MDEETGLCPDQFKKQTKFDLREVKLPKAIFANTVAQQTTAPKQIFRPAKEVDLADTVCKTEFPTTDDAAKKKDAGKTADGYGELGVGHGDPGKHGTYIFASNIMEPGLVEGAGLTAFPPHKAAKISGTKFEKITPQKLMGPNFGPLKQPQVTAFPIVKYPKIVCVEEYGTMPAVPPNALKATKLVKVVKQEGFLSTTVGDDRQFKSSESTMNIVADFLRAKYRKPRFPDASKV
uniref:Uncharacterized protein n=1 Tax=Romanomermis culicivorax TaxID=13658 RepID=A0A915KN06_ROMCU